MRHWVDVASYPVYCHLKLDSYSDPHMGKQGYLAADFSKLSSWVKHIDFIVIDLLSLTIAFVFAYRIKFGDFSFIDSVSWKGLLAFLLLSDFVITMLTGPYSGIFRRSYWEDIRARLVLALWSFIAACVAFYLLKIGEAYSREMLVMKFSVYFVLTSICQAIWKKHLLSRRENLSPSSVRRMVVVANASSAKGVEAGILANDMASAKVVGFCLVDSEGARRFDGRPVVAPRELSNLALKVDADEVIAAIVKLSYLASGDSRPIFYKQIRVGQCDKRFNLWKLRSMVWNADEKLERLLKDSELRAEWERDQKLSNDPRITPVGRFLRSTSLGEMPQFFNVLKGDMSMVGPRPLVPGELEEHGGQPLYNKVKPGITGWWGCNGRNNIDNRERLELEYHYVKHCSLYLDLPLHSPYYRRGCEKGRGPMSLKATVGEHGAYYMLADSSIVATQV